MMSAPPSSPGASPDGTALSGTFDEGLREGEEAAEGHSVAGYFVLGAVTAPLVVLCVIGLANSKGDSGGCGGGGGSVATGVVVAPQYLPSNASYRTNDFVTGYNQGYEQRLDQRQGHAFAYGLVTGAAITIVGIVLWVSQDNRQKKLENEAGNHASAGGRRPGALFEF